MTGRRRGRGGVSEPVDFGTADLIPDADHPSSWTLLYDGRPQSHVDLANPARLHFEYMRHLAAIIDTAWAPGLPLRVLHLGGGALSLPRYVAATRSRSAQLVIERDGALVALVRENAPLPPKSSIRVRIADAVAALPTIADARFDLVIGDFPGQPAELTPDIARVLAPQGIYAANVIDGPPLRETRQHVVAAKAAFDDVCLLADRAVLRRRRPGNLVLAASKERPLPMTELNRLAAKEPQPVQLVHDFGAADFAFG
ncbi:MAG: fused MFS/spermidine synthase [Hamadaea sp.]|nr:fused MFS/spermidine synthase [Hamadaea sp.]